MTRREKAQETIAEAAEVRRDAEEVFWDSMRTELAVVHTMCTLAEQEDGQKRAHHLQQAEKAFEMVLNLASRVAPDRRDRDAIEEARQRIRRLGGRDFSQPHD
jgi:hypothetical protein